VADLIELWYHISLSQCSIALASSQCRKPVSFSANKSTVNIVLLLVVVYTPKVSWQCLIPPISYFALIHCR
jgi:hypothetical protein